MFRGFAEHAGGPAPAAGRAAAAGPARAPLLAAVALAALTLIVVALGVYPSPLLSFIGSLTTAGF
jgi:hypothetical protein